MFNDIALQDNLHLHSAMLRGRINKLSQTPSNTIEQCYQLKKFLERLKRNNRHLSRECNKILIIVCADIYYYQRKTMILKENKCI